MEVKKVILSGIQPSGALTLGSYLGAIKNWAELADSYDCYYMMADMHTITVRQNPADLRRRTLEQLAAYIAAGLDPEGRDTILSQVKEYHKKTGTTVLLVSHSMEDIARYANKVLVMAERKLAMYDTVERVFDRAPELLELGLSVPQVTKIFLKLREMGIDVPTDVYTIPYAVKTILEAKARRDAGENLTLPRRTVGENKKGGEA